jgi:hypothetical protein
MDNCSETVHLAVRRGQTQQPKTDYTMQEVEGQTYIGSFASDVL